MNITQAKAAIIGAKTTIVLNILKNNDVMIDKQFIGKINGLKLELDLKKGALETDIKSLKKAARQTVGPELEKRVKFIIETIGK